MKKYSTYIIPALVMICFFLVAENVFAQSTQNAGRSYVKGITNGRAKALATGVLGLISLVLALRAKRRLAKNSSNRNGIIIAFVLSLLTIVLSGVQLIASSGAVFGSGSGKAGAIVALLLGLVDAVVSGVGLRKK